MEISLGRWSCFQGLEDVAVTSGSTVNHKILYDINISSTQCQLSTSNYQHKTVTFSSALASVLWHCWLGDRKGIWPVKKLSGGVLVWLSVWSEVQTCIWPSGFHCHSLSLAPVKSRLVLPFWYRLTRVVPDRGPLNGCVCVCVCVTVDCKTSFVPHYFLEEWPKLCNSSSGSSPNSSLSYAVGLLVVGWNAQANLKGEKEPWPPNAKRWLFPTHYQTSSYMCSTNYILDRCQTQ